LVIACDFTATIEAMLRWLRWRRAERPGPLTGAPDIRRVKTYPAASGYVYEYVFEGRRATREGVEYVFSASAGRAHAFHVSVMVPDAALEAWQASHGRELSDAERYGIAKLALRQAFDDREHPGLLHPGVRVAPDDVEAIANILGLD
jgi:hypothetical protein